MRLLEILAFPYVYNSTKTLSLQNKKIRQKDIIIIRSNDSFNLYRIIGIFVKNIRYFGSEPWPFPDSLMVGFTADYAGGDLVVDRNEIESAFWFDREHLPRIPEKLSISRTLIDWWIEKGR